MIEWFDGKTVQNTGSTVDAVHRGAPAGWKLGRVRDLIESLESGVSVNGEDRLRSNGEKAVLKVSAVSYGIFDPSASKPIKQEELTRARCNPKADRVIISPSNTPDLAGASAYIEQDHPDLFLSDKLWQTVPRKNIPFYMRWFAYFLSSPLVRHKLSGLATGTSNSIRNITKEELLSLPLPIPGYNEQKEIANALLVWDEAIGKTTRLMELKVKRRRSLARSLIFGVLHLRGRNSEWKEARLKDVTRELKSRNKDDLGVEAVMAVNKFQGLIPMREHVMASSLERYKLVPPKAFAYNPMRINIGSLAMSHHASNVLVSPDYVVFQCLEDRCDPGFLDHYRRTHAWEQYVNAVGNGSVRVRIYYSELARMKLRLPPIEEQKAISEVLNDADREIELTKQQLAAFQKQKRGLMQKLLTGKWRLKTGKEVS